VKSVTIRGKGVVEGAIAEALEKLETDANGAVSFGSYPWFAPGDYGVHLVARSAVPEALAKAADDLKALILNAGGAPEEVEEGAA